MPLAGARLLAPVAELPSIRDFYAFEQHVRTARSRRGLEMHPDWYELPVFYFTNPAAVLGPGDPVAAPPRSAELDYELEVACVLGRGGASFEMLVQLVRRLPVMVCPRWVETASQPIALADAVGYLADAARTEATRGQRLEVGGPEVLTYREMMVRFARLEGRRRLIVTVPLFTPGLSSRWIGLVTDVPAAVARPLAEGLRNRVVVSDGAARRLMPRDLATFEEACRAALTPAPGAGPV